MPGDEWIDEMSGNSEFGELYLVKSTMTRVSLWIAVLPAAAMGRAAMLFDAVILLEILHDLTDTL